VCGPLALPGLDISSLPVLTEAYSSQYKRVVGSNIFSRALKRYRQRIRDAAGRKRPTTSARALQLASTRPDPTVTKRVTPAAVDEVLEESRRLAEEHLATMPHKLLRHAQSFNETVQYLMSEPEAADVLGTDMPDELKQMMDDVAGVEKLGERIKKDILNDAGARNVSIF